MAGPGAEAGAGKAGAPRRLRRCGLCLCFNPRQGAVLLGLVDAARCTLAVIWFIALPESPKPAAYGYSWIGQMRSMMLPEACVSWGAGVCLVYGAARRRWLAITVSAACLFALIVASIAFALLMVEGIPYYGEIWLLMPLGYIGFRAYSVAVVRALRRTLRRRAAGDDGEGGGASDADTAHADV